ncbi:MAG: hypothetical protein WDN44_04775 [Sphingomonas sp.]
MIIAMLALAAAAPACGTLDARLPRDLAGWTRAGTTLDTGHAVTLAAGRGKAAETRVTIRKAGLFGIAADQQAWIDVYPARGARAFEMASESKGPYCSTIRKIVRYRLRPGTYRVTATKLTAPRVKLMLAHDQPGNPHEVLRRHRRYR